LNVNLDNPEGTSGGGIERRLEIMVALMDMKVLSSMMNCFQQCRKRMARYYCGLGGS